ncbi:hypothetical protein DLAC_01229 [Tieghemostelium lacteum]|uniref:PUM-HD domain-containing protein n=1 Tax=Tieghemostelium lacteum TaxID=361077 RepID=A0A152A821_TIELA|nr:hypothetical protein DLAC_01229 [Tieghemostelium lacteum]|eukprot:KYR02390.1 hypothetical protein DLAC_01229 [Tieghemostelium lacteum]
MDYSNRFFFTMTDVLSKSESPIQPNTFPGIDFDTNKKHSNTAEENDKKQKLVYTSDFLRKFDKNKPNNDKDSTSLFHSTQNYPPIGPPSMISNEFMFSDGEKDKQISDYKNIIQRLKTLITSSKDESLISMMKGILSEYHYGKSFSDEFSGIFKKMENNPIQNFVYLGDLGQTPSPSIPVTPLNSYFMPQAVPTQNQQASANLPPLRSPRKIETSNPIVPPLPLQQQNSTPPPQPQGASYKSPRKISSSNESNSTNNTATTTINPITPPTQQTQQIQQQQQQSLTNSANKMKKSPSMPVIAAKKDFDPKQQQQQQQQQKSNIQSSNNPVSSGAIPPLKSSTSTTPTKSKEEQTLGSVPPPPSSGTTRRPLTSSASQTSLAGILGTNGPSMGGGMTPSISSSSISSLLDHQPRKPMTKSVSMSSISNESNTIKCTSLEEITGQIYHLTKYQAGCRFLQKKLEENPDPDHVTLIFKEVFEHLIELMVDPYGQYLIPQLMKYCDNNQRRMIVDKIAPKVETFACHVYGIHGIQKVLQFLSPDQVESIIDSIRGKVISLSKDAKGNYLIQSFLKQFSPETNQFICNAIMDNVVEICTHKVGCTVVNRCIDHSNAVQLERLVDRITESSMLLVQDQYGNYVVQHLLSNNKSYATKLIKSLLGHIAELSVQKYSSNVIEKCLQVANHDTYESIIKEITEADILNLLQDKFANFVIQTALDVADENQHAKLVKLIVPYIHQIKTPYVIHIQKKILQV